MKREPDEQTVYDDDSGTYDVRSLRKEGRIVYVERPSKTDKGWLLGGLTSLFILVLGAAWGANAQLASLQAQVTYLRDEVSELKRILEPRYRGGADDPHAR